MKNGEDDCYGVNWVLYVSRYMANIKTKQSKNRRKSKRHTKGKPHNRGKWLHHGLTVAATTGRGGHHGLAVVSTVVAARFCCSAAFWCPSVLRLGPRVFAFLGVFWASLQASFDPQSPHFISLDSSQTFLPKSWLES